MTLRLAADAVLVVHFAFIAFIVAGGFLARRRRGMAWLHGVAVAYGVVIQVLGFTCPLTPLENRLRRAAGQAGYDGGFVEHYLVSVIYPGQLTVAVQGALIAGLVAVTFVAYRPRLVA